jgi:diadenosine tetraphosphate (Ap4A) HIT family hydrolase
MAYIEEEKPQECIFCIDVAKDKWRDYLILTVTTFSVVMLNKFPYNSGHLLVAPHRHTASLEELPAEEFSDLMAVLRQAVAVVSRALRPQGMNLGMNLGKCAFVFKTLMGILRRLPGGDPPPLACCAALAGRYQLHARGGRGKSYSPASAGKL